MDRRHFCKIATLTLGALALQKNNAAAAPLPVRSEGGGEVLLPVSCRVTVIRRECYQDLQDMYLDDPEEGPCRAFETGDTFLLAEGDACPKAFCPRAWQTICRVLRENGGCAATQRYGLLLASCPDGSRPVVFKIECS